jgi:capsular exopolysaccharide synthesis family protein
MRFSKTLKKAVDNRPVSEDSGRDSVSHEKTSNGVGSVDDPQFAVRELKFGRPAANFLENRGASIESVAATTNVQHIGNPAEALPTGVESTGGENSVTPTITISPTNVHERLVAVRDPESSYTEDYRALRTQLVHKKNETGIRSVVILSFGPGEGKSITALNLAWLLAQTDGISTALVDGDLRQPSLAEYLGQKNSYGLAELLRDRKPFAKALTILEPAGLRFIQGGETREDVAELISSSTFRDMHDDLVERFDFTIIDAPPLSLFTDASAMLEVADAGILVVRANQVSYQALDRMMRTLPKEKLLSVVLNHSEEALINRDYYYYSNYRNLRK